MPVRTRDPGLSVAWSALALLFAVLCACGEDGGGTPSDAGTDGGSRPRYPTTIGGDRPAGVYVPPSYDGTTAVPLVVLLHGYSASAAVQDAYLQISRYARTAGYLVVLPDGMIDDEGNRYWYATTACCGSFDGGVAAVDDVAYLSGLIDEAKATFEVDEGRVYLIGHSNGAFMAYVMACEAADRITAIAGLAGSEFFDASACTPSRAVGILHVHGTADDAVLYEGESGAYPGAVETVERWAMRNGCDATMPAAGEALDLDVGLPGADTTVARYATGCEPGGDVELWTIEGGTHIPVFEDRFIVQVWGWLSAHSR